jgi:hypothetical protein
MLNKLNSEFYQTQYNIIKKIKRALAILEITFIRSEKLVTEVRENSGKEKAAVRSRYQVTAKEG